MRVGVWVLVGGGGVMGAMAEISEGLGLDMRVGIQGCRVGAGGDKTGGGY